MTDHDIPQWKINEWKAEAAQKKYDKLTKKQKQVYLMREKLAKDSQDERYKNAENTKPLHERE